jgi:two-component system, NtrC family, C4-dicarboxylate transport sensor histidine kinase DctB
MVNLLSNAMQAMEKSTLKQIVVRARRTGDKVNITVEDYGPGIAQEDLARVFDPFFTTKQSGQGLGLGLTITERILKEMGGEITVQSSSYSTRFDITLAAVETSL